MTKGASAAASSVIALNHRTRRTLLDFRENPQENCLLPKKSTDFPADSPSILGNNKLEMHLLGFATSLHRALWSLSHQIDKYQAVWSVWQYPHRTLCTKSKAMDLGCFYDWKTSGTWENQRKTIGKWRFTNNLFPNLRRKKYPVASGKRGISSRSCGCEPWKLEAATASHQTSGLCPASGVQSCVQLNEISYTVTHKKDKNWRTKQKIEKGQNISTTIKLAGNQPAFFLRTTFH